jgi:rsbT co-antagonist protein RsbR
MQPQPPLTTPADSHTSNGDLLARIANLEQALRERDTTIAKLSEQNAQLQAVIDHIPYAIYWKDRDLVYRGANRRFVADLDLGPPDAIIGRTDADLPWQAAEVAAFEAIDRRVLATQKPEYDDNETVIHPNGIQEWFETYKLPLVDASGKLIGVLATYNNITARKRAEATVDAQATLLQELSTPVIPITDQVLVLPLVGAIDSRRAQQVLAAVLDQLAASHAQIVFLDITGVPIIDTQVAHALIQTSQAVQLLGARLVLTGIRPEVAQALVGLGVELGAIVTYSTLQRGLADVPSLRALLSRAGK